MAYSLYDASVKMANGALGSLEGILTIAEQQPNSEALISARLVEDMNPLSFQVYYAALLAERVAALLSGQEYELPSSDIGTYEEMHSRIARALEQLKKVDREKANAIGDTLVMTDTPQGRQEVPVKHVISIRDMTNLYFHVGMTYAILRKEGVPVGKRQWTRPYLSEFAGME
jgi:hypothetical protein